MRKIQVSLSSRQVTNFIGFQPGVASIIRMSTLFALYRIMLFLTYIILH